jgi:hypothetical protein
LAAQQGPRRSRFWAFYDEYLVVPLIYGALFSVVTAPVFVLVRWTGFQRIGPRPLGEAIALLPYDFALVFSVTVALMAIARPWKRWE